MKLKDLACVYEVTSIIGNSNYDQLKISQEAIAYCLKSVQKLQNKLETFIPINDYYSKTSD